MVRCGQRVGQRTPAGIQGAASAPSLVYIFTLNSEALTQCLDFNVAVVPAIRNQKRLQGPPSRQEV